MSQGFSRASTAFSYIRGHRSSPCAKNLGDGALGSVPVMVLPLVAFSPLSGSRLAIPFGISDSCFLVCVKGYPSEAVCLWKWAALCISKRSGTAHREGRTFFSIVRRCPPPPHFAGTAPRQGAFGHIPNQRLGEGSLAPQGSRGKVWLKKREKFPFWIPKKLVYNRIGFWRLENCSRRIKK